jgi:hypothetical protein
MGHGGKDVDLLLYFLDGMMKALNLKNVPLRKYIKFQNEI